MGTDIVGSEQAVSHRLYISRTGRRTLKVKQIHVMTCISLRFFCISGIIENLALNQVLDIRCSSEPYSDNNIVAVRET